MKSVRVAAVALLSAYPIAGLIGGAIPVNRDWIAPDHGVEIFVETNGVHVGIVVPKRGGGVDWTGFAPAGDLADPRYARYDHLAIGWGERDFFLGTPTWADLRPGVIVAAAIGGDNTLLHVEHVARPVGGADVRRIVMTPHEYRRLAAYIMATRGDHSARFRGYGGWDVFYGARGRYDAGRTCNAWVGEALRFAGVGVGAWTPFPATIFWWFAT